MHRRPKTKSPLSLSDCLSHLCSSPFWSPLPCREVEIAIINDFLRRSFAEASPRVLVVVGDRKSGKTSALKLCASMSPHAPRIRFVDSSTFLDFPDLPDSPTERNVLVFDDFPSDLSLLEIADICGSVNYSMVFVSDKALNYCEIPVKFVPSILNFGRYGYNQFVEILREKVRNFQCVPLPVLQHIAGRIAQSGGTVPDAVEWLTATLRTALADDRPLFDVNIIHG
jgi:hypothetical protein